MFPAGVAGYRSSLRALPSGLRVRVVEYGPPDGPPVLLVHGWACSAYSFRETMPALGAAGYRAIAADLKGHGLSDKPDAADEYSLAAMWEQMSQIMDALDLRRAALVGHSMGGALVVHAARMAPDRVTRLVLLGPAWFGVVRVVWAARLLTPRFVTPVLPYLIPRWVVALVGRLVCGKYRSFTARDVDEYWAPTQFPEYARALRHLLHEFHWRAARPGELRTLHQPTLVLFGTRDLVVRPTCTEECVREMPDAHLEWIAGAGHVIAEEVPAQVNAAMLSFLAADSKQVARSATTG